MSCCLFLQERKISVTWSRNTGLPQASSQHASPKDQTVFSAIILSTNELQLKLHSHHHAPAPLLFLCWLLIDWHSRSTKYQQFPLMEKCVNSASLLPLEPPGACSVQKHLFFFYTFFLQMSSRSFLHYTRLGNAFSTGVSWHDSPLKLRINVLYH